MRTVCVITSRWNSQRLPGKALAEIKGKPLLRHIVDAARGSQVDEVAVGTTNQSEPIIQYCFENGIPYLSCKEEDDLLERLYLVGWHYKADVIVRLWGDCPFIESDDINKALVEFKGNEYLVYTTPRGTVAVVSYDMIKKLHKEVQNPHDREWIHAYMMSHILTRSIGCSKVECDINTPEDLACANKKGKTMGGI